MIFNNRTLSKRGFTLIELLVALFIVTIGITALVKFQSNYFYYSDLARQRAEAIFLAKTQMESLRTFEVLTTTSGYTAYSAIASESSTDSTTNTTYTTTWTVTNRTNYKTVNMVTSWTDRRSASQTITLTSIIGKIDPTTSGVLVYG